MNDSTRSVGEGSPCLDRRGFLRTAAVASAFTILPRRVLGGPGHVAPSDRINVAQIGCGTQGIRQTTVGLIQREDVQITCVCDPNTDSSNYVDWGREINRAQVRNLLEDPAWGEHDEGIRAGREVARQICEAYYGRARPSGAYEGVRSYADFRDLLDRESDVDAAVIITPDHTHAAISRAALGKGIAAISHKPVSNVLHEVRRAVAAASAPNAVTHLLAYGDFADYYRIQDWIDGGQIGPVREVHNWSFRPSWPQGWLEYPSEHPPVPPGFDWDLWLGPVPHRPYHPDYTFALYRGWFDFGGGSFADMGNYSLWGVYRMLELDAPVSVEARPNSVAVLNEERVAQRVVSEVAYPMAGTIHFRHAARADRPAVDVFWYEGGIRPRTPQELIASGEELDAEGMMFIGDHGMILCRFRGTEPRLFVHGRQVDAQGEEESAEIQIVNGTEEWIEAVKNGRKSRGSFENVAPLAEATALQGIAFRLPGRRLEWDSESATFPNRPEANQYVRREYRSGWDL